MTTSGNGPAVTKRRTSARAHRGTRRRFTRPASRLAERWTTIDGVDVFYRESPHPPNAPVMMHLHGFGLSGRYQPLRRSPTSSIPWCPTCRDSDGAATPLNR